MLCGDVINLKLISPPLLLVLDPLDALDLCLWHGQVEISLQPIPLVSPLCKVLDHNNIIACQQFHRVLPKIREVVGPSFADDLRDFDPDLVVPDPNDLERGIVWPGLYIKEVGIGRELLLNIVLDLRKELVGNVITIKFCVGAEVLKVPCIISDFG